MATLLAHIKVKPGMEAQFEEMARGIFEPTHENEPGCRRYEYMRGSEKGQYYALLSFDDFDAFMTHQVADYHMAIGATLGECITDFVLEWVDPVNGASPLVQSQTVGTPKPDAGEMWNSFVESHSEPTPAWWSEQRS